MKKITLLLTLVIGLFSTSVFSQFGGPTIEASWDNPVGVLANGQTIDLDVSWVFPDGQDFNFLCIWVRELGADGSTVVNQYGDFVFCPARGVNRATPEPAGATFFEGQNTDSATLTLNMDDLLNEAIPGTDPVERRDISSIPLSSELPEDHQYILVIAAFDNSFASADGGMPITIGTTEEAEAALSVNDFAKENISASISQKDGIVTIADSVETEDYKLYDMTGALVIEKEADGILDINGLPNGVYILATDAGLTKIGK